MSNQSTVHLVDEKLPVGKLTALGLQHVMVMYAGAVAVPRLAAWVAIGEGVLTGWVPGYLLLTGGYLMKRH